MGNISQTQSYGPEARGGSCKAEVVISGSEIDYPKASKPDVLLSMNQSSCETYFPDLKSDGLLVVDATMVEKIPTGRVVSIPFTKIARQQIGDEVVANMVALGAIGYLCHNVTLESLEKALIARVPRGTEEINLRALRAGIEAARNIDVSSLPAKVREDDE
jgi:2-oxoglutarate ferredoxin oxidoreductase subunit gamma